MEEIKQTIKKLNKVIGRELFSIEYNDYFYIIKMYDHLSNKYINISLIQLLNMKEILIPYS